MDFSAGLADGQSMMKNLKTHKYTNEINGVEEKSWWALRDSNPRPSPCKGAALPLRQAPETKLVPASGIEPLTSGL